MSTTKTITESEAPNSIQTALAAGALSERQKATVHRISGGKPYIIDDDGVQSMEHLLLAPVMVENEIVFADVPSFVAYVNEFKDDGSKIFGVADLKQPNFRAILDYHIAGDPNAATKEGTWTQPRWGYHVAKYTFPHTPEWDELLRFNRQPMKQLDFAELVERLRLNFKTPDGATMLELARNLEGKTEGSFKSSINTDNGDRELLFTSTTTAIGGKTDRLYIPTTLELFVQPFLRGASFTITAYFRYRVSDGEVKFTYELVRPHDTVEFAVQAVAAQLEEKTGIKPLFGVV
jgi:uncharacterized protein YfdQ (DUF2303 family)